MPAYDQEQETAICNKVMVSHEVGRLRRLLVHSPDSGLGKVTPSKAQDWLFEDIVHLDTMRRDEYDYFTKLLLYFLDPDRVAGKLAAIDDPINRRNFYKPGHPQFHGSDRVVEIQQLLTELLQDEVVRTKLVASICAVENVSYSVQEALLMMDATLLGRTLISGTTPDDKRMIFAPIPNLIFARDVGIVINDHILLNKPARQARMREALIMKYIFFNHPYFESCRRRVIELADSKHHFLHHDKDVDYKHVTLEGGDFMMVAPNHLVVGISERTTAYAVNQVIKAVFDRELVDKVSVIRIPKKRDYMHIDTVFTQVRRDCWVLLGSLSKRGVELETREFYRTLAEEALPNHELKIWQFEREKEGKTKEFAYLEDLLTDISQNDLGVEGEVAFVYSGNNEYPFGDREQWTDSCNLLALREGVVVGYDRNDKTAEAFRNVGFDVIDAAELLHHFEIGMLTPDAVTNTLIMLPSAELSRARGGSRCMSMPLWREAPE
ncbi:arginine deiminase [Catalinimonas alkaloidigena]|uniref:arginine deiminase n=1 Tax=Catalinimonas alkaloidigena TaxID=1075417 RepID=A0A1G9RC78_9BACT|nr:arginine deiminase family protein [Catalinimonas alkaloidigena]SDM20761.1 arginine deiminase [Catalinimonas alkaloidigena]